MNFFLENLRNPAHIRRAGLMRQFSSGQLYSRRMAGIDSTGATKLIGTGRVAPRIVMVHGEQIRHFLL
jgi:hypothetical protein